MSPNFFARHREKIKFAGADDCWLWTAGTCKGYGTVRMGGKMRYAHRVAYEAEHGAGYADGPVVRHKCDVPLCVNPAHLELGTHADNVRDMVERGRQVALKGETCSWAKLTEADVQTIRAEYVPGSSDHGQSALARRFGVSRPLISLIANRKIWTHAA